ncbi:MAG: tRNA (adenosine(37)-N6)-threonylcarbamoyltransferase complex ATPase subunit type 1 TsaE [Spiroplasma sp.]
MKQNYQLKSLNETKLLAKAISKIANKDIYLLLSGQLATGKTQLTKFIGSELGVTTIINSPSFVILNQYDTKHDWKLIHIDAYRLNKDNDFNEYFELTIGNFTIIEWPEKINWNFNTNQHIIIHFNLIDNFRSINIEAKNLTKEQEQILINFLN